METAVQTCCLGDKKCELVAMEAKALQTVAMRIESCAERIEFGHIAVLWPWKLLYRLVAMETKMQTGCHGASLQPVCSQLPWVYIPKTGCERDKMQCRLEVMWPFGHLTMWPWKSCDHLIMWLVTWLTLDHVTWSHDSLDNLTKWPTILKLLKNIWNLNCLYSVSSWLNSVNYVL